MYGAGRRARRSNGLTRENAATVGSQGRAGGQSQPRGNHAAENATSPTGIINSRTSPVKAGGRDCEAAALHLWNSVIVFNSTNVWGSRLYVWIYAYKDLLHKRCSQFILSVNGSNVLSMIESNEIPCFEQEQCFVFAHASGARMTGVQQTPSKNTLVSDSRWISKFS